MLRKLTGLSWREALWPRLEPTPWEQLPASMQSVLELENAGRRIEAVKMYRELTGADLKTSLDAVKRMSTRPRGLPRLGRPTDRQ